ncbi:MAG: efflux transporter, family, subunit [Gemmatimonadetes bacterium]|nr:efflux transporter, family, subunit [Gemmatimonadota bacterium]
MRLGTIVLFSLLAACSKAAAPKGRPSVPVVVTRARLMDVPYTIEANGVVVPLRAATVGSQVEGIIKRVAFAEGQNVTAGQVLFEIDPRPYHGAYQQALAALNRDKANAENARREADRYAGLAAQDYVTKEQAEQQRANAAASSANVAGDEAALANAKFNLDNTTIRAPISGRTGALLVKEGNLVHANGATPLVVINQISPILVRFAIPATQLPLLQRYGANGGLVVTATPNSGSETVDPGAQPQVGLNIGRNDPGAASTQGGPPGTSPAAAGGGRSGAAPPSTQLSSLVQAEHGSLSFIDNAVDTTTGTVLLKATFPNPNQRLWAGEFVASQLNLFVEQNALVVPTQAVVTGQSGSYVYVITDSGTATQRPVTVERTAGSNSVIASGLRNGEQVVTDGQSRLTPNAKVQITTPQGATPGGRGAGRGGRGRAGAAGAAATPGAATGAAGGAAGPSGDAAAAPASGTPAGGARAGRGGRRGAGAAPATPAPR